jgi:hypothetical protein
VPSKPQSQNRATTSLFASYKQRKSACRLHRRFRQDLLLSSASLSASPEHLVLHGQGVICGGDVSNRHANRYQQPRIAPRAYHQLPRRAGRQIITVSFRLFVLANGVLHEYLGAYHHTEAGVSCQDRHITFFEAIYMLTIPISFFLLRVLVRTIFFFLAATLVESRRLEATYANVSFAVVVLYRVREFNVPTNVYPDHHHIVSSDLHHFHAFCHIVFTSASSVSRIKFAVQATIDLSPPDAGFQDTHRIKLRPPKPTQPVSAAIVTATAAYLATHTLCASPPSIRARMIRRKPAINQTDISIVVPTRLRSQVQHRPSQLLRGAHSLRWYESARHDAAGVLPGFGDGDGHVCWEPFGEAS